MIDDVKDEDQEWAVDGTHIRFCAAATPASPSQKGDADVAATVSRLRAHRPLRQPENGLPRGAGETRGLTQHIRHRGQEKIDLVFVDGDRRKELDDLRVIASHL